MFFCNEGCVCCLLLFFLSVPPDNTILECVDIERAFLILF